MNKRMSKWDKAVTEGKGTVVLILPTINDAISQGKGDKIKKRK